MTELDFLSNLLELSKDADDFSQDPEALPLLHQHWREWLVLGIEDDRGTVPGLVVCDDLEDLEKIIHMTNMSSKKTSQPRSSPFDLAQGRLGSR